MKKVAPPPTADVDALTGARCRRRPISVRASSAPQAAEPGDEDLHHHVVVQVLARRAGRGRRRPAGRSPAARRRRRAGGTGRAPSWPGTRLDPEHRRPPRASVARVDAVEAGQPAVVAVQDGHHLQRVAAARRRSSAPAATSAGRGAAGVDGVGEVPRRHAAGLAEERLDVGRRRAGAPSPNVAASVARIPSRRPTSSPTARRRASAAGGVSRTPAAAASSSIHAWRSRARDRRRRSTRDVPPAALTASVSALGSRPPPPTSTSSVGRAGRRGRRRAARARRR